MTQESPSTSPGGRNLIGGAIASLAGVGLLVALMFQNTGDVRLDFLSWRFTCPLWLLTIVLALLGALVCFGLGAMRRHRRRKERRADGREPSDAARQTVVDAFWSGVQLGDSVSGGRSARQSSSAVKMATYAMKLVGLELARNVQSAERASLCIPVDVVNGKKVNSGAIMLLEDRVVLAWSEFALRRPRSRSVAFPLSDVGDVQTFKRKVGKVSKTLNAISFTAADQEFEVVFYPHERIGGEWVSGFLQGGITFNWNAETASE